MEKTGNIFIIEAEDNFKRVHKSIIESEKIDCETLGVYTRIIVLGTKWNLNIKGLSSYLKLSDNKIRKAISSLEREGYIVRTAVKREDGKFAGWNYKVLPYPVSEEKRSSAGKRTYQKTDTPQNGQLGLWTTPKTDNTENGIDYIYKPKEDIDLINKDNNKIDCSIVFDTWNKMSDNVDGLPKVTKITERRKKKVISLVKSCDSSIEELVNFIKTIPYADDWVIGKASNRKWCITFDWLIANTSNWYVSGLEGNMHKQNHDIFFKIMKGEYEKETKVINDNNNDWQTV